MKKLVLFVLISALFGLTACGSKGNGNSTSPTPTMQPTVTSAASTSSPTPSPEPTQAQPDSEADVSATIDNIHKAVKEMFGENYIPDFEFDETMIEEQFGIKAEWYDGIIAEGPMIRVNVEKLIVAHATEGHFEDLYNALTAYQESIQADLRQYPINLPKIQGSVVDSQDNYVFFIMLGSSENEDENAAIEECREINEQVATKIKDTLKGQ